MISKFATVIALFIAISPGSASSKPICDVDCVSMDFVMCAAYSKVLAKGMTQLGSEEVAVDMLIYYQKFAGYAIKIGQLEGHRDIKTYEAIQTTYKELEKLADSTEGQRQLSLLMKTDCRKAMGLAKRLHPKLFPR